MYRLTRLIAVASAAVAMTGAATLPASAQSSGAAPEATEVGVTAKEIRIAVLADVDNPIAPGLLEGSRDAVEGFARYINKAGGLAGRKVVVDFIDTKLNANEARNAVIKACAEDFAMVGTAALFLTNVDDQLACVDQAGVATGLPDLPFLTTDVQQQCSPITFPVAPPALKCDTARKNPQTYQGSAGRGLLFEKKYGKDLHGVYIFPSDVKAVRNTAFASGLGQVREICCASDQDVDLSVRAPQSAYTPAVLEIKSNNSTYAQSTGPYNTTVALRKEAKLQGVTSVKVWDCANQCYDPRLIADGGADVENQYATTLYLPFLNAADRKANKMASAFYKNVGADSVGKFGAAYSWIAGIAFRDAVNSVVKKHGVNGLTRANLLEALRNIHHFDADGFLGGIDLANREIGPCFVTSQVQGGEYVRVHPKKPGTFDCPKQGVVHAKLDLIDG